MADQKKVITWNSKDNLKKKPAAEVMRIEGTVSAALKVLKDAHAFMVPFVKLFSKNTGDAYIAIAITYVERDREPEPMKLQATEYERCFTPTKRPYPPQPFLPAPTDYVRHATDLPCPTCQAQPSVACDPSKGEVFACNGNGLSIDDPKQVLCHNSRYELLQKFADLQVGG